MFDKLKGLFGSRDGSSDSGFDPTRSAIALVRDGRHEASTGGIARAIEIFQEALRREPDLADAHEGLAEMFVLQNRDDDALTHFQRAVELEPTMQEAHYQMGRIYLRRKDVARATAAFHKELTVTPRYGRLHNDLAVAYMTQKNYAKAIEHADLATSMGEAVHENFLKALAPHRKKK